MFQVCLHVKQFANEFGANARSYSPMALRTTTWSLLEGHGITEGHGRPKGSGGSPPG